MESRCATVRRLDIGLWGLLAVVAAALALGAFAPSARAYVYIADARSHTIDRATDDGTVIQYGFIHGASNPAQVVVTATHIYWLNGGDGSIGAANIDGSEANPDFIPHAFGTAGGIAVDSSHIYWTDYEDSTAYIARANLDGSGVDTHWLSNVSTGPAAGISVDGSYVYWAASYDDLYYNTAYAIGRAPLSGGGANPMWVLIDSDYPLGQMVSAGGYLFFAEGPSIGRLSVSGTGLNNAFGQAPGSAVSVATDGSHLYWTPSSSDNGKTVDRVNLDGTNVLNPFLTTTADIQGMAADALAPPAAGWPGTRHATGPVCVVPKLIGLTLGRAKAALARAHCGLGPVTRHGARGARHGRVLASHPAAGTRLAAGSPVGLVIAR